MNRFTPIMIIAVILFAASSMWYLATSQASAQETETNALEQGSIAPSSTLFSYQGQLLDNAGNPITNPSMPMTFRLYPVAIGGTACWTEPHTGGNAVNVEDGRFHVLLGQITPIPGTCIDTDVYLELIVDSEILSPRELLTSVAYAVEANTLKAGAITRGSLGLNGTLDLLSHTIDNIGLGNARLAIGANTGSGLLYFDLKEGNSIYFRNNIIPSSPTPMLSIASNGNTSIYGTLDLNSHMIDNIGAGNARLAIGADTGSGLLYFDLKEGNRIYFRNSTTGSPTPMLSIEADGDTTVSGSLTVEDCSLASTTTGTGEQVATANTCTGGSIESGAYIESNLMTPEERGSERISRFEQGDLLCWSGENERLEKCSVENDSLVMAVASINGKPIVLGAELIKVIGPVAEGDYLVASNVPGYAIATKNPTFGIVIAQALETFDGESGLIMAMIRKM